MIASTDDHRAPYGVGPACEALRTAPSARHAHAARRGDPGGASPRRRRDAFLRAEVRRVHGADFGVHGAREVRRQPGREGVAAARCAAERPMRDMGLRGVVRGKEVRTTLASPARPCPADRVDRRFRAPRPDAFRPPGFTRVATRRGFVHAAFVVHAFAARRTVGWRVPGTAHAGFVPDALERALRDRRPVRGGLIHHGDRGPQRVCVRCAERLAEAGVEAPRRRRRGQPRRRARRGRPSSGRPRPR